MKGQSCLGIARDQANIFFVWMIGDKAEGIPYRHCHKDEDYIRCWLSSRISPANFHESMIGQSTKLFMRDYWLHEKEAPSDTKKAYEPLRMDDTSQKFLNFGNACQFLFMQYAFTTLRCLLSISCMTASTTHGSLSLLSFLGISLCYSSTTTPGDARLIGVGQWLTRLVGMHFGKTS